VGGGQRRKTHWVVVVDNAVGTGGGMENAVTELCCVKETR